MKPFTKVRRTIERHALLEGASGVVVAVSGGPDSVALLDMLMRVVGAGGRGSGAGQENDDLVQTVSDSATLRSVPGPRPLTPGPFLHIAHLNHKLRGADADADAEFVRRLAERLKLPVTIECADVRAAAEASRRGIEETAREVRYCFLLRVARESGADRIATGHTMSDQAETFLMRLARGAGTRGLAAMRPIGPAHKFAGQGQGAGDQGPVKEEPPFLSDDLFIFESSPRPLAPGPRPLLIRPLLDITRGEVEAYCAARGLDYRVDATNLDGDFTRNRLRRDVLPALRAVNPRAVQAIARAAEHLASDQDALDELAKQCLDAARVKKTDGADDSTGSIAAYHVALLRAQPAGLQRRMLREAIERASADVGARGEITSRHIAAVQSLLGERASGKHTRLPGGIEVWREYDAIIVKRMDDAPDEGSTPGYAFEFSATHSGVEAGGLVLMIERGLAASQYAVLIRQAKQLREECGRDWSIAVLDDDKLPATLIIRPRPRGARARVAGHGQTIKLKKLMIDHTIPASRRPVWPVVLTPDDCYVWSPGLPPAVDFVARGETRTLAIVRALNL
ncbi:MAG: tRNA lysidine(34) synthetase TilS [Blastocatellia bacterium]